MKNTKLIFLALFITILFSSCLSIVTTPVSKLYPERWEKTYVGMPTDEFKQVWPDAKGPSTDLNKNIIYTVFAPINKEKYTVFVFSDNKLIGYHDY